MQIINIRFFQGLRTFKEIGVLRSVFLLLVIVFLFYIIFNAANLHSEWLIFAYTFFIALIHFKRSDKIFLRSTFQRPATIMAMEYILISVPLIISLSIHQSLLYLVGYFSMLSVISFTPPFLYKKAKFTKLTSILPPEAFEWKSGLRKGNILIVFIYLVAISTSFHPASIPVSIFILSILPLSYYEKGEPLSMLFASELPASSFILHKTGTALKIYILAMAHLLLIYMIFNFEYWYIPIVETAIFSLIIVYMLMLKYAFYLPNEKNVAGQIFVSLGIISVLIPALLPLIIILTIYFYHRALNNLNPYLNDYN